MKIDVFTLFPSWFEWFRAQRHVQNAQAGGLELNCLDLRATTPLKAGQVDDTPYGGGAGMVLRVDVVEAALRGRYGADPLDHEPGRRVIAMSAGGRQFDDALANDLARADALTLLCGRYEGFDERIRSGLGFEEVSIGDYVLSGGEVPAMVIVEGVVRLIPGALGDAESPLRESFQDSRLEFPQYTRPPVFRGMKVPEVLVSGDHQRIARWREEEALKRTRERRRDLLPGRE